MVRVIENESRIEKSTAELVAIPMDCSGNAGKVPSWGVMRWLRRRHRAAFQAYMEACRRGEVAPGMVLVYEVTREDRAGPRLLALVAVKERVRDQTMVEHVGAGLLGLRDVVVRERVSSVSLAPLGFEPELAAWDDAWPALRKRIREVFRGVSGELVIEVHAPATARSWPSGCPSVAQLHAGRLLSGWGVRELADAANMSPTSVSAIENRKSGVPRKRSLLALRQALESRGVEFGPGGWVRMVDDRGLVIDGTATMSRSVCKQALEAVEKARRILRGECGDAGDDTSGETS